MTINIWLSYVLLALTFLITPGISHLLMLSNSASYGIRRSLATAMGDLTANTLQMFAAGFGMAVIITQAPHVFLTIKWLGVAYLVYLGLKMIFTKVDIAARKTATTRQLFLQGFVTSASNPKAIIFFAALFPQFITPEAAVFPQVLILTVTYLVLDGSFLLLYGLGAERLSKSLKRQNIIGPISGLFIIGAAILLARKSITGTSPL